MPGQVTFVESMTGFVRPCPPAPPPSPWRENPERFDATVHEAATSTAGPASALELSDLALRVRPEPGPDDGLHGVALSGLLRWDDRTYRITGGEFVALATTPTGGRRLRYRLLAESGDSNRLVLAGVKIVTGRPARWWRDTTRMFALIVTGTEGSRPRPAVAGRLDLPVEAFARQLGTFTGGLGPVTAFLWRFGQRLVRTRPTAPTTS
jgi:hypothetical protein